ncbi:hypothetical protein EDB89DRAFT_2073032 [Lactarius sanguifluus]|nr:hypothetical protein EDB89DRAFT_2073032 [Lactarius sanguifluus]
MLFYRFVHSGLLSSLLGQGLLATAASDPCVKVAGLPFADPADAIACQKSFPFNETLRQNVLSVVSRVFDFYTFEDFYLNSPPPFQESTTNIRANIARINAAYYATDYDFNRDLWNFTTQLNDGHTRWFPNCYQNILPAPVVILDNGIFIAPDSGGVPQHAAVELWDDQFGTNFTDFFAAKKFNWQRLAGARVLTIGGLPASDYIDEIARTVSGNFLDHNIGVNSVVSSYRILDTTFSRHLGDLAGPVFLTQTSLNFSLIPVNTTTLEFVDVPFVASSIGAPFTDGQSYWANNCAATNQTNGVDLRSNSSCVAQGRIRPTHAALMDPIARPKLAVDLPDLYLPTLSPTNGSTGVIKSFILPGNRTGVMFIGSFSGVPQQFPLDVDAAFKQFKASGVTNLLIDVTYNTGGFICLALFLHQFLTATGAEFPGFQTTLRANPLAQKIVKAVIQQGHNSSISFYAPDNWQFLNGTQMPLDFDYNDPSVPYIINGLDDPTSQRFEDICPTSNVTIPTVPPLDLNQIAIIGNGICASTCALFATVMFERHQTKIAVFGGNTSQSIQFKGTLPSTILRGEWILTFAFAGVAGNQVLQWVDLDTEVKTAGLKDDPLAPPDLLVNGNMPHNWRSAYSFLDENVPIAYVSEQPQYRFPYTAETYNNPQNVWLFA